MSMHDVADGKTLRFWEMYYEYYFKDSTFISDFTDSGVPFLRSKISYDSDAKIGYNIESSNTAEDSFIPPSTGPYAKLFDSDHGFNVETVQDNKHLIEYLEIYQYHGGRWSMVHLVRPVISKFQHDTMEYSNTSDTSEMTFTCEYEYALYHNFYSLFGDEANERTGAGSNFEFSNNLEIDHPPNTSDFTIRKRTEGEIAKLDEKIGTLPNDSLLGNLVSDVSDVLTTSPAKIGDSAVNAIKTGEWESPIDTKAVLNGLKDNADKREINIGTKNLKSTVSNTTGAFTDFRRT
jgi:hypothetical protein